MVLLHVIQVHDIGWTPHQYLRVGASSLCYTPTCLASSKRFNQLFLARLQLLWNHIQQSYSLRRLLRQAKILFYFTA